MYPTSVTPLPISPSHSYTRISPPRSPPSPHTASNLCLYQGVNKAILDCLSLSNLSVIERTYYIDSSNKSGVRSLAQLKSFKQILGP